MTRLRIGSCAGRRGLGAGLGLPSAGERRTTRRLGGSLALPCVAAGVLVVLLHVSVGAAELPAGLDGAIDHGLLFLQRQQKEDGSFEAQGPPAAMAGLAVLAFLSNGHTPELGRYGPSAAAALDYLLRLNPEGGYYGHGGGKMYGHAIVTIALAEAHGVEGDEVRGRKVRAALERCLRVLYAAQDARKDKAAAGGWRYEPAASDSDLSASGWCIMALRACDSAGLKVPKERIDRAVAYMMRCHNQRQRGFGYMPGEAATPSMTGLALTCLHLTGTQDGVDTAELARLLIERPVKEGDRYFYHGLYHTTQGAFQAGGPAWRSTWGHASATLMKMQRKEDGSWPKREDPGGDDRKGRFYSTSMAVLTLSVPMRLLPMHQR